MVLVVQSTTKDTITCTPQDDDFANVEIELNASGEGVRYPSP